MHDSVLAFIKKTLSLSEVEGKEVLEIGSQDFNGSPRSVILPLQPKLYVGVDSSAGSGVDLVCNADALEETFGPESFDVVLSTEVLEHVRDWRTAILQMKRVVRESGLLLITTRSPGFPYHPYPIDVWRYTQEDFRGIFRDMEILALESDPQAPGVFLKAVKPAAFVEAALSKIEVEPVARQ